MFQSVGERLNAFISFVLSRLKRIYGFRHHRVSGFELIIFEFGMTTMLVLGGSYVFHKKEKWSYLDSIYYSLVTFWTIGKAKNRSRRRFFDLSLFLGFGDYVPLASLQRNGQSFYSHSGYFMFTISFILFGLALVASSLNLLVLRLAQFHSQNGIGGISALLGRNEEDLIAAAIAEHRASLHIQQRTRVCSNANSLFLPQQQQQQMKSLSPLLSMKTLSWRSVSSSSSTSSPSSTHEKFCCHGYSLFGCKRRRRHWHLRRSPQNIRHLLTYNQLLENHKLTFVRKSLISNACQPTMTNHHLCESIPPSRQQRISI